MVKRLVSPPSKPLDKSGARVAPVEEPPRCKVCGVPLMERHQAKIGVHIRCVYDVEQRAVTRIPSPGYRTPR